MEMVCALKVLAAPGLRQKVDASWRYNAPYLVADGLRRAGWV